MNDTLASVRSLDADSLLLPASTAAGAHVRLTDRLELRIGLWLLLRSTRRLDAARNDHDHARKLHDLRTRIEREHAALRVHALGSVRT